MIRLSIVAVIILASLADFSCRAVTTGDNHSAGLKMVRHAASAAEQEKILEDWNRELEEGSAAAESGEYIQALYHYEKALEYVNKYGIDDEGGTEYGILRLFLDLVWEKKDLAPLFAILDVIRTSKDFGESRHWLLYAVEEHTGVSFYDNMPETEARWTDIINSALSWWQTNKDRLRWDEEKKKFVVLPAK